MGPCILLLRKVELGLQGVSQMVLWMVEVGLLGLCLVGIPAVVSLLRRQCAIRGARPATEPTVNTIESGRTTRPVFRGDSSPARRAPRRLDHSRGQVGSQTNAPLVLSWVGRSRAHGAQRLDTDNVLVTISDASPETIVPAQPAGLYLRGMAAATVDNVERFYRSLINVSPTLESLPRVFSLQQYPSGAAVVLHPAFADAALVEQVVYELGANMNSNCYC